MSWWLAASAGLSILSGASKHNAEESRSRAQRAWQDYTNKQIVISASQDQNTVTTNELRARKDTIRSYVQIQQNEMRAAGAARVSAAAAGVSGNTVDMQALDIAANAARREKEAGDDLLINAQDFENQRDQIVQKANASQGRSAFNGPSVGATLLGIGAEVLPVAQKYFK